MSALIAALLAAPLCGPVSAPTPEAVIKACPALAEPMRALAGPADAQTKRVAFAMHAPALAAAWDRACAGGAEVRGLLDGIGLRPPAEHAPALWRYCALQRFGTLDRARFAAASRAQRWVAVLVAGAVGPDPTVALAAVLPPADPKGPAIPLTFLLNGAPVDEAAFMATLATLDRAEPGRPTKQLAPSGETRFGMAWSAKTPDGVAWTLTQQYQHDQPSVWSLAR